MKRKPIVTTLFLLFVTGCISPSSHYRNIQKGQHEISAGVGAGLFVIAPTVGPEVSYRYGLTRRMNLRLQIYNYDIFSSGINVGVSDKLITQNGHIPEIDAYFDLGAGGILTSDQSGFYLANRAAFVGSYNLNGFFDTFLGISWANMVPFLNDGDSIPKAEIYGGIDLHPIKFLLFRLELKAGFAFNHVTSTMMSNEIWPAPFVAIYPGVAIRL